MARSVSLVVWSSILLACVPPALRGQSTPCVATGPETLSDAVWNMRRRYNGPDSATTINAGRLWASRNQIYAVTDSTTCVQAVAAYNAATNTPGAATRTPVRAKLSLKASRHVVQPPNTSVTFTAQISPTTVGGITIPWSRSWRWVPDAGGTQCVG
jgi:hypothetical protein